MMRQFHELRRHEEGQALVLAAISMLILCLCVLATVNIAFNAKQRIELQNAADAGAYSIAAYEARALNFFAYSNRAMVVHYAAALNFVAMVSYIMFSEAVISALSMIPVVGQIIQAIAGTYIRILGIILDVVTTAVVFAMDGLNLLLAVTQKAVSTAMLLRTGAGAFDEVRRHNPDYQVSSPVNVGGNIANAIAWADTVDTGVIPSFGVPTDQQQKFDRALMTEIANSARHAWTAYGAGNGTSWSVGGLPRRAHFGTPGGSILVFRIGKHARAEYGSRSRSSSGWGAITAVTDEYYSTDQLRLEIGVRGVLTVVFTLSTWAAADRRLGDHRGPELNFDIPGCGRWNFVCKAAARFIKPILQRAVRNALANLTPTWNHFRHYFHLGQYPYAKFKTRPSARALFNQPANVMIVTMPTTALEQRGRPFIGRYGANLGLSSANSGLGSGPRPQPRGGYRNDVDFTPDQQSVPTLPPGLHAISAAVAYYHRPGDWREPPNLFNPLWGAKLVPVVDHPLVASNPLLQPLLAGAPATRLLVH